MKSIQMFETALGEMAYNFSSNEFARTLRKAGCPERLISQYQTGFLRERCTQDGTKRMWIKEKPEATPRKKPIIKKQAISKQETATNDKGLIRKFLKWIY